MQQFLKHRNFRYRLFSILCILVVLLSGSLTLLWQTHQQHTTRARNSADAGNIIGPPTLPAATVNKIFAQMGSPMVGTGQVVEQVSRQVNIDDGFALGVWWTETNDGAAGVGSADRNPGSVRGSGGYPSAYDGYTIYPSYVAAILDWFSILRSRYVSRGLTSAYTICYPYVGTSSALLWAGKVVNLMYRYRGEAPPIPPTATMTPKPAISPTPTIKDIHHKKLAHLLLTDDTAQGNTTQAGQRVSRVGLQEETTSPSTTTRLSSNSGAPALPLVLLGLLVALAIALGSLFIGRTPSATENVVGARFIAPTPDLSGEIMPTKFNFLRASKSLPTLEATEAHPITEALAPNFNLQEHAMPQLDFPTQPLLPNIYQPVFPSQSASRTEQPEHAFAASHHPALAYSAQGQEQTRSGGLLRRYGNTEALPGKVRLVPSRLEPPNTEDQDRQEPHTESLSEREPVPVSVRREGLLRQYAKER